jgi:hypothetical protein
MSEIQFETKEYKKPIKNQAGKEVAPGFTYATIALNQLLEWGVPEIAARIIYHIVDRFLRTWPLKNAYLKDFANTKSDKKGIRDEALKNIKGIYAFDWTKVPREGKESKWGDLKDAVPLALAYLKEAGVPSPTDEQIKKAAETIRADKLAMQAKIKALLG